MTRQNKTVEYDLKDDLTRGSWLNKMLTLFCATILPIALLVLVFLFSPKNLSSLLSTLSVLLSTLITLVIIERKAIQAKEAVCICTVSAVAIISRMAFFFVPQFKPILAIIAIAGLVFGLRAGFLCGVLSMLISNFMFGQGAWTAWQMCGAGAVGAVSGIFKSTKALKTNRIALFLYGLLMGFFYGLFADGFMILSLVAASTDLSGILSAVLLSLPFTATLAFATALFLSLIAPMLQKKLVRIIIKYGI